MADGCPGIARLECSRSHIAATMAGRGQPSAALETPIIPKLPSLPPFLPLACACLARVSLFPEYFGSDQSTARSLNMQPKPPSLASAPPSAASVVRRSVDVTPRFAFAFQIHSVCRNCRFQKGRRSRIIAFHIPLSRRRPTELSLSLSPFSCAKLFLPFDL